MAESALPRKSETAQRLQIDAGKQDTPRVVLPSRSPPMPSLRSPPLTLASADPLQPSPKKETARIAVLPNPLPHPALARPAPRNVATSEAVDLFDSIPRWFCWGLLGLSSLIFLIQIWNYALS